MSQSLVINRVRVLRSWPHTLIQFFWEYSSPSLLRRHSLGSSRNRVIIVFIGLCDGWCDRGCVTGFAVVFGFVHVTSEEFHPENGSNFSDHTTPEEFKNAVITDHSGFAFEENLGS